MASVPTHSPNIRFAPVPKRPLADVAVLWVSGLALLIAIGPNQWFTLEGRAREWIPFLLVGTLFPALVWGLVRLTGTFRLDRLAPLWKLPLALVGLGGAIVLLMPYFRLWIVVLALVQWLLVLSFAGLTAYWQKSRQGTTWRGSALPSARINKVPDRAPAAAGPVPQMLLVVLGKLIRALVGLLIAVIAWTLAARLFWWDPSDVSWYRPAKADTFENWLGASSYTLVILMLAAILVAWTIHTQRKLIKTRCLAGKWFGTLANLIGLVILTITSFRTSYLVTDASPYSTVYHWSLTVRPAEVVRQGGWLLWDVPSLYGFLNEVVLAVVPTASVWQSVYLVSAVLNALVAGFLFLVLRSSGGVLNFLFALSVTLASVLLLAGWPATLSGPQVWPTCGALRFFWCYVLLAILLWDFARAGQANRSWRILTLGCAAWVLGVLWSLDSAVFTSVIWLPAYFVRVVSDPGDSAADRRQKLWRAGRRLLLPFLFLAIAVAVITVYYELFLGHGPDWTCFVECALYHATQTPAVIPGLPTGVRADGPAWLLLLLLCGIATTLVCVLAKAPARGLALAWGAWAVVWAASSYYWGYPQSDDKITQLAPLYCTAIGLTLILLHRYARRAAWATWVRLSFAPFFTVLLTAAFGNWEYLKVAVRDLPVGYVQVEQRIPPLNNSVAELLEAAGVRRSDPIAFVEAGKYFAPFSSPRAWLPFEPWFLHEVISKERQQVYLSRFTARARLSGYLLTCNWLSSDPSITSLMEQIRATHTPVTLFESDTGYQLFYFQLKGSHPSTHRPEPRHSPKTITVVSKELAAYARMVEHVRQVVERALPPDATVLVVSKGDDDLLKLGGRKGRHFPEAEDRSWAGHPADGAQAVAELKRERARGAQYLLLPQPFFWWLDEYADLRRYLEQHGCCLYRDDDCIIYQIVRPKGG
jgi:hypothetical protein